MKHDYFSDSTILEDLNRKSIRNFLDEPSGTGVRNGIKPTYRDDIQFYVSCLSHYKDILDEIATLKLEHIPETWTYPLYGEVEEYVNYEGVKFQYTFVFEAFVWYMQRAITEKIKNKEKNEEVV